MWWPLLMYFEILQKLTNHAELEQSCKNREMALRSSTLVVMTVNWEFLLFIYSALSNRGTYTAIYFAQKSPPIFPYSILYFYTVLLTVWIFRTSLQLRFYVKSLLVFSEVQNLPFLQSNRTFCKKGSDLPNSNFRGSKIVKNVTFWTSKTLEIDFT